MDPRRVPFQVVRDIRLDARGQCPDLRECCRPRLRNDRPFSRKQFDTEQVDTENKKGVHT